MIRYDELKRANSSKWYFLLITLVLTVIGLIFIYSSSSVFALEHYGRADYFVYKQLWGLFLGLLSFGLVCTIPVKIIAKLSPLIYLLSLSFTALTLITRFSSKIHGASRWLKLGAVGLQPSEFLKLAFILYISYLLVQKRYQKRSFWGSFVPLLLIFGSTALVLLKQPDFGLTVVLSLTLFALLIIARLNGRYLIIAISSFVPIVGFLIWFKPYRLKRILIFLDPWSDPQGGGFQIIQSLIAIGSGGLWGVGLAHSRQKFFYLPMQHTDFIFAIIAEEIGFVGCVILIALYVCWLYFGMRLAWSLSDEFARFATLGFVILISLQAVINFAVATGLFPTKGVGLPFISYGCSGLVSNIMMVGLVFKFACVRR